MRMHGTASKAGGRDIISGRAIVTAVLRMTSAATLAVVASLYPVTPATATPLSPGEPCQEGPGITCVSPGEGGIFEESVTAQSADRLAEVVIPEGTRALTTEGAPPTWIKVGRLETPWSPPSNHTSVTNTYNFEPEDTTFDSPVVVTLRYYDKDVPAGVKEERLVIAAWSSFMGEWVKLDSVVDTADNVISAETTRLTAVAIIAATAPASFRLSQLALVPEEVGLDEPVMVSALVENTGDLTDVLHVEFRKNGKLFDSKEVTLDGGRGITVSSEVTSDEPGRYTVSINDLAANFTVKEPEVAPPPALAGRADIQFTDLRITPATAEVGQAVTIGIVVMNHGDIEGTQSVSLLINGRLTDSELIKLAPGDRQVVTFVMTEHVAGAYSAVVDGWGATFTVKDVVEPPGVNWGMFGRIIGGAVAVAAGLVYLLWPRRRKPRVTPEDNSRDANQEDPSARPDAEGRMR